MDFTYGNPITDGSCDRCTATLPQVLSGFGLRDYSMKDLNERPHPPTPASQSLSPPTPASQSLSPASLITIRMQEICRSLSANYTRLLNEVVFVSGVTTGDDRKTIRAFKRTLDGLEANTVLSILWRESPYITDNELSYDGHAKLFSETPLTCYCLAVHLASSKNEVAATNSRVRLIIAAGAAFNLINKIHLSPTKIHICGTKFLHEFMVRLGFENARSCAQILWQDEVRISAAGLPFTPRMDGLLSFLTC